MSDNNNDIQTVEQSENGGDAPVVSGPSDSDVKNIDAVSDDHPLVQQTGRKALEKQAKEGAAEFISDAIYEEDAAFVREWLQNHETACVRAAKLLVRASDDYEDGWLQREMWVDSDTGEKVCWADQEQQVLDEYSDSERSLRKVSVPRSIDEVLEAAKTLGYDPTIVFDVYRDERKLVTEDNGIGMTPYEFDEAFNTVFKSGSGVDGDTGGMFGVGSESSALVHGKNGGMEVETRSRRPGGYDGFRAYSYLGGANPLPGEVSDDFRGTRFSIPVQLNFDIGELEEWVERYTDKLRVPVLYREHESGHTPVEEEYPATNFLDDYAQDALVTIDRPGEFTLATGRGTYDTSYRSDDENTFLVSMPIDRNHSGTFSGTVSHDGVVQIHDEQSRIVSGPHRGLYTDGNEVFETSDKETVVGELHEDDIVLPEPTGSRDSLQKDSLSEQFFDYITNLVKEQEREIVGEIRQRIVEDGFIEAFAGNQEDWKVFQRYVSKYGPYAFSDKSTSRAVKAFRQNDDLPDLEEEDAAVVHRSLSKVELCPEISRAVQKKHRKKRTIGKIVSQYGDSKAGIFMAASTSGRFKDYYRTLLHNYDGDEFAVVVLPKGSTNYEEFRDLFGFKKLVDHVPLKQDEDTDIEVPDKVHEKTQKRRSSSSSSSSSENKELKFRTGSDNSISVRMSVEKLKENLDEGNSIGGHRSVVLFPRGKKYDNISDYYELSDIAAIACVKQSVFEELHAYSDRVMLRHEFLQQSKFETFATEDGAKTTTELMRSDKQVQLYLGDFGKKLLTGEPEELRDRFTRRVQRKYTRWHSVLDGYSYRDEIPDSELPDTLMVFTHEDQLKRACYAFQNHLDSLDRESFNFDEIVLVDATPGYAEPVRDIFPLPKVKSSELEDERFKMNTHHWDDDSPVYKRFQRNRPRENSWKEQVTMAFHDLGIDPTEKEAKELRDIIIGGDD